MKHRRFGILFILLLSFLTCGLATVSAAPFSQTDQKEIELALPEGTEETVTEEITREAAENEIEEESEPVEPPEAPVPENPQGEISARTIGFYWAPSLNAEYYEVSWQNTLGYEEILLLENDDWTCQSGRCIVYTELPTDGSYTWTVSAVNEAGTTASEEISFSVSATLPAPDVYRPDTALSNQRPLIFEWEDIGNGVSIWRIQVSDVDTDQIIMDVLYSAEAVSHVAGQCYLESNEYLPTGSYVWRVQGRRDDAVSNWSAWMPFSITCAECDLGTYLNTTTITLLPNGMTKASAPVFMWQTVTGAMSYQLEIKDSSGVIVLDENVPSENCQVELCSYQPEITFEAGESYTWSIVTYGWNNSFWGSADGAFAIISDEAELNDFEFVGPESNASLDPDNQQIVWTDPGASTAAFRLGIRDDDGEWLLISDLSREAAWCDGITCSIQFYSIPEGENYEIVLIPYSELNTPGKAVSLSFTN